MVTVLINLLFSGNVGLLVVVHLQEVSWTDRFESVFKCITC